MPFKQPQDEKEPFITTDQFTVYEISVGKREYYPNSEDLPEIKSNIYDASFPNDDGTSFNMTLRICPEDEKDLSADVEDADDIYIKESDCKIQFSYPLALDRPVIFQCVTKNNAPITKGIFIQIVRMIYAQIYEIEEKTTTIEPDLVPNMLNRNKTNGQYGIWGHGIEDLFFEGAYRAGNIYMLHIGS